jgi:hypothetical protein
LEPVPESFDLLSANTIVGRAQNVSLINAAASDAAGVARMTIPKRADGLDDLLLIVEDNDPEVSPYLAEFGYSPEKIEGSANRIYRAAPSGAPQ